MSWPPSPTAVLLRLRNPAVSGPFCLSVASGFFFSFLAAGFAGRLLVYHLYILKSNLQAVLAPWGTAERSPPPPRPRCLCFCFQLLQLLDPTLASSSIFSPKQREMAPWRCPGPTPPVSSHAGSATENARQIESQALCPSLLLLLRGCHWLPDLRLFCRGSGFGFCSLRILLPVFMLLSLSLFFLRGLGSF